MAKDIEIKMNNIPIALDELSVKKGIILRLWGMQGETNAKKEITTAVYDTPQSPDYQRTGNLRNSLTYVVKDDETLVGTNVHYAKYVELGTSKMRARPYLKPAIENHLEEYKKILKSELKR